MKTERIRGMQNIQTEIDKGSEQYARLLAQEESEWHVVYDEIIEKKLEIFDQLLRMHTEQSYALIETLIMDKMTLEIEKRNADYGFAVIFTQIFKAQKAVGECPYIFDYGDSLAELIEFLQRIKFCMWEIEFLHEEESEELLCQLVVQNDMKQELLRNLILIACLDRQGMREKLRTLLDMNL